MDEEFDVYEDVTLYVPKGGHLSPGPGGLNYGSVLSDENNQVMAQSLISLNNNEDDDEGEYEVEGGPSEDLVKGVAIGAIAVGISAVAYQTIRKKIWPRYIKPLFKRDTRGSDVVATIEDNHLVEDSKTTLSAEQQEEMARLLLALADAQHHLNNLVAQGLDESDVKSRIALMLTTLAECDPKALAGQVNCLIEQQHPQTNNLALLLGRQPSIDHTFQPVMWQDIQQVIHTPQMTIRHAEQDKEGR